MKLRAVLAYALIVWVILPFVPLVLWAFGSRWFFPELLPEQFDLRAWRYLAGPAADLVEAFLNSTIVASVVTLLAAVLGIPAGRALGMHQFRGKEAVEFFVLAPLIVPPIAVAMGMQFVFIRLGLVDQISGVILVHLVPTLPYMIVVMRGVFANFDADYEEQARTLGADRLRVFLHVTFPAIFPGIVTGSLFVFLVSWSQYVLTLLIGGGRVMTLPVLLFAFATSGDNTVTAAVSLVFVAPAVLILLFTARYLTGRSAAIGGFGSM